MDLLNLEVDPVDQILREHDETIMALPDFESEPHLLMSKVRKHYMEYVIKLLSVNYETHQKLVNKNIYLPSAIWRCAKNIEMSAAQACMVVQLYRKNMISVVNQLKCDTKKGKLHKNLYEFLNKPPSNDKKIQTPNSLKDNNCQCVNNKRKRFRGSISPKPNKRENQLSMQEHVNRFNDTLQNIDTINNPQNMTNENCTISNQFTHSKTIPNVQTTNQMQMVPPIPNKRMSVESQDSDELMLQLEKLFQGDTNDDDLFEGTLCDKLELVQDDHTKKHPNNLDSNLIIAPHDTIIENHAAQIKSLDERLANLTGLLVNNDNLQQKTDTQKARRSGTSKWLCEEYFLKQKLHDLLDQIGDKNRKELEKIKGRFIELFGYDSDDEGVLSPLEETPEFIISCKERIAPWVVKLLTPYYIKGRIKGKGIFKALAKHLIRLIYQCSRYPEEYEVNSFVTDFLKNHKTIRCEADFKEFKIENI